MLNIFPLRLTMKIEFYGKIGRLKISKNNIWPLCNINFNDLNISISLFLNLIFLALVGGFQTKAYPPLERAIHGSQF